jgi:hypothetical protein
VTDRSASTFAGDFLDFFTELAHVIERAPRLPGLLQCGRRAVGIKTYGTRRQRRRILQLHRRILLDLTHPLRVDVAAEDTGIDAPLPNRLATVIVGDTAGLGIGFAGH